MFLFLSKFCLYYTTIGGNKQELFFIEVKNFRVAFLVARVGLRPILILPIGNSLFFAKKVGPIVPCHAPGRKVFATVFLVLRFYEGQYIGIEIAYGLLPSHNGAEVARHPSTLPFEMFRLRPRAEGSLIHRRNKLFPNFPNIERVHRGLLVVLLKGM